jgi:hypothetical protein
VLCGDSPVGGPDSTSIAVGAGVGDKHLEPPPVRRVIPKDIGTAVMIEIRNGHVPVRRPRRLGAGAPVVEEDVRLSIAVEITDGRGPAARPEVPEERELSVALVQGFEELA